MMYQRAFVVAATLLCGSWGLADSIDWSARNVATYAGGNLYADWQALIGGDAAAGGKLELSSQAVAKGDLFAGGAVVTGWQAQYGSAYSQLGAEAFRSLAPVLPTLAMSKQPAQYIGSQGTLVLTPGTYGDVCADWRGTLQLSAGSYYFDNLTFSDDAGIKLDTTGGDVRVFVAGNMQMAWSADTQRSGAGGALFTVGGKFGLVDQNLFDASVVSGGPVTLGWNSRVAGQVLSNSDVTLASQARVGGAHIVSVPEPTALAVLAGMLALVRRR